MILEDAKFAVRFWKKVRRVDDGGCWEWQAALDGNGYGKLSLRNDTTPDGRSVAILIQAHRASWELENGLIPDGQLVLHRCDNPPCVRPSHLFLGTQADNMVDKVRKGRDTNAKLNPERVRDIRARLGAGESLVSLARRHGVTPGCIWHVRQGHHWRHVP